MIAQGEENIHFDLLQLFILISIMNHRNDNLHDLQLSRELEAPIIGPWTLF